MLHRAAQLVADSGDCERTHYGQPRQGPASLASRFQSPLCRVTTVHRNVHDLVDGTLQLFRSIQQRTSADQRGLEANTVIVVDHENVPGRPPRLVSGAPAPPSRAAASLQFFCSSHLRQVHGEMVLMPPAVVARPFARFHVAPGATAPSTDATTACFLRAHRQAVPAGGARRSPSHPSSSTAPRMPPPPLHPDAPAEQRTRRALNTSVAGRRRHAHS